MWQASAEKICFTRFEIHGLAVFLPNANGHFEAINHKCPNYYLSQESIALFQEQGLPSGSTSYIVGQIVHLDRKVAVPAPHSPPPSGSSDGVLPGKGGRGSSNPYGLPMGTEYYVATIAMVPDLWVTCWDSYGVENVQPVSAGILMGLGRYMQPSVVDDSNIVGVSLKCE